MGVCSSHNYGFVQKNSGQIDSPTILVGNENQVLNGDLFGPTHDTPRNFRQIISAMIAATAVTSTVARTGNGDNNRGRLNDLMYIDEDGDLIVVVLLLLLQSSKHIHLH